MLRKIVLGGFTVLGIVLVCFCVSDEFSEVIYHGWKFQRWGFGETFFSRKEQEIQAGHKKFEFARAPIKYLKKATLLPEKIEFDDPGSKNFPERGMEVGGGSNAHEFCGIAFTHVISKEFPCEQKGELEGKVFYTRRSFSGDWVKEAVAQVTANCTKIGPKPEVEYFKVFKMPVVGVIAQGKDKSSRCVGYGLRLPGIRELLVLSVLNPSPLIEVSLGLGVYNARPVRSLASATSAR